MTGLTISETWNELTVPQRRDKLMELESLVKEFEVESPAELPLREYFCNGVYAREIEIAAGTTLIGEIHLHAQINVLSKGTIRVATEEGVKTLTAPATFVSPAGTKRAGFAITDTVWTVFHATTHTNTEDIRRDFITPNYEELDKRLENNHVMGSSSNSRLNSGDNPISSRPSEESREKG